MLIIYLIHNMSKEKLINYIYNTIFITNKIIILYNLQIKKHIFNIIFNLKIFLLFLFIFY